MSAFVILRKYGLFLTNNPLAKSVDYFQSDFGKGADFLAGWCLSAVYLRCSGRVC
ncbi:hypothetical protein B194_1939 [Serratia plymuthica A30]|nr:hypothetical protein B194_1939 [Serratia plymuthica A30]